MPSRAFKVCKEHECNNLTQDPSGYCPNHIHLVADIKRQRERLRGSSKSRGYDCRWEKLRKVFVNENPLCHDCMIKGIYTPTKEVHHIKKVRDFPLLRLVKSNLMGLCKSCHSVRTARGE